VTENGCKLIIVFQACIVVNDAALDSVNIMIVCYSILNCKLHRILFRVKAHETLFVNWIDITSWQYCINIPNMHALHSCSLLICDSERMWL
jgi:hypothetical protein